jgi:hypothetical protein
MTMAPLLERTTRTTAFQLAFPPLVRWSESAPPDDERAEGDESAIDDAPYARPTGELELLARCPRCRVMLSITAEVVEELRQDAVHELFHGRGRPRGTRRTSRGHAGRRMQTDDRPPMAPGGPGRRSDDRTFYRPHLVVYDPKVEIVGAEDPSSQAPIALVHRPCGTPLQLFH